MTMPRTPMPDVDLEETADPMAPRILVVEDSASARRLLQQLLLSLGVRLPELRLAATIPEALQYVAQWAPAIAFIDLELRPPIHPDPKSPPVTATTPVDGIALTQELLKRDPKLQIVVCSATDARSTAVAEHVRSGRIQAIVKPVLAARVQEVLARAAETRRAPPTRRR